MKVRTGLWLAGPACCGLALACTSHTRQAERIIYAVIQQDRPTTQPAGDDDIERARQEALRELEGGATTQPATQPTAGDVVAPPSRPFANFNPDITVFLDGVGTWSPDRENDFYNRFDIREAELDLRAAVHPRADGVLILAVERDVHNELFGHHEEEEEEEHGFETTIDIEEGYLNIHDTSVPNLAAKIGRFHLRFGRQNMLHLHDLPATDPPFVNQAFLAPEALVDSGVSFSYLIPPELTRDQYIEVIAEIVSGEGAGSESPVLAGDFTVDSPAVNLHALWNADLNRELNLEVGGSFLTGHRDADNAFDAQLFGVDITLIRTDPSGGFRNSLLQAEAIYGIVDSFEDGQEQNSFGVYVLGQQQINRDWFAGLRLDWTQNPDDEDQEVWGTTPYVSWYWNDFLRFRLMYQHRDGDIEEAEDSIWFQTTFLFGAHPPHPYWAMR